MKVKEISEILEVPSEEIIKRLENIDIEANEETDIDANVVKKLSKLYGKEIKRSKVKKEVEMPIEEIAKQEISPKEPSFVAPPKDVEGKRPSPLKPEVEVKKESPKLSEKKTITPEAKKPEALSAIKQKNIATQKEKQEIKPIQKSKEEPKPIKKEAETTPIEATIKPKVDVELRRVYDDTYEDFEEPTKTYTRLKNVKKHKVKTTKNRQANVPQEKDKDEKVLYFNEGMSVAKISDGLGVSVGLVVRKLMELGYMADASKVLERDVIELLALEFGYELKDEIETDITKFEDMDIIDDPASLVARPPIVTIMGHVDHGKTTLLDTIRNTKVVSGEAGGITQHIGAYQVKKSNKLITFIDTPGHAAFTEMRARGAEVTDIVILVVAADDGVKPQTIEAIEHAKAAHVPIIVAINKIDKPAANPERVKQELANYDLLAEEWGGSTIFVPLSALTGKGVEDLLEMILLVSEMEQFKANPNRLGIGTVVEAKVDRGRGIVATLLVKNGSIHVGDPFVAGNTYGKIRAMQDETKANLKTAGPSKAVEVTGFVDVPNAGDRFMVFEDEKTTRLVAEQRLIRAYNRERDLNKAVSLSSLFDELSDKNKDLNLIIKGDVQGSIEALRGALEKVNVEGVKITIVRSAVGAISETDISLAIASNSIIIGFNVRPTAQIMDIAKEKEVEIRLYNIIYKVIEDIEDAMKGLLDPVFAEKVIGQADVRETYKVSKVGTIAGCYVTSGEIRRNCEVRLIRESIVVYEGKLSTLKRFKDDVKEVKTGYECGMTIENFNDIKVGDMIEAFIMEKVK